MPFICGDNMQLPERKANRLKNYDYNTPGAYFITVCTKDRKNLFWENVGATIGRPFELSEYGKIADTAIKNIPIKYSLISVDKYIIMPNHIHLILQIHSDENGRATPAPTVSAVIEQMKGYVTKQIGFPVFEDIFYDYIIRNEREYDIVFDYIEDNYWKWKKDSFYSEKE